MLCMAALALGACGSDDEYANNPRPPSPVNVTAAIIDGRISISPAEVGAGPVVLIITNQESDQQQVTIESSAGGGVTQSTAPIAPRDTATIKVDLTPGDYRVRADDAAVEGADLTVGPPRESAQNELLQP